MEPPYEIGYSPDKSYVFVRAIRQPFTSQLAQTIARELIPLGAKMGINSYLLDLRGTQSGTSPVEKHKFAYKDADGLGVLRQMKTAILKDPDDHSPDFLETVMHNAGFNLQIFDNESQALNWLQGDHLL